MSEGNFVAVGVGAIDVVESHCILRYNLERVLACLENFGVNLVAQSSDQAVNSAADFCDDQVLRRRIGLGIDLDLITALAQAIEGCVADVSRGKDADFFLFHAGPRNRQIAPHTHTSELPMKKPALQRALAHQSRQLQMLLRPLIDAIQRLLQIFDGIRSAEAQVTLTEGAKRRSRQPGYSRVLEQGVGQLLRRPAGLLDIRKGVKRAFGQPAGESLDLIDAAYEHV